LSLWAAQGGPPAAEVFGADHPWFPWMAENLHAADPTALDAVLEFDPMHAALESERLFPRIACPALILQPRRFLARFRNFLICDHMVTSSKHLRRFHRQDGF
jgi:hypothetical protein